MGVMSFFEMRNSETSSAARVALVREAEGRCGVRSNGTAGEVVVGRVTDTVAAAAVQGRNRSVSRQGAAVSRRGNGNTRQAGGASHGVSVSSDFIGGHGVGVVTVGVGSVVMSQSGTPSSGSTPRS